jgi:hypothetical protein
MNILAILGRKLTPFLPKAEKETTQARFTLTKQPWGKEMVRLVLASNGPESRASMA